MFEKYGGRRFFLTVASGTIATIMQWYGKLDAGGSTYSMIVIATVAAYITGNVIQKRNDKVLDEYHVDDGDDVYRGKMRGDR